MYPVFQRFPRRNVANSKFQKESCKTHVAAKNDESDEVQISTGDGVRPLGCQGHQSPHVVVAPSERGGGHVPHELPSQVVDGEVASIVALVHHPSHLQNVGDYGWIPAPVPVEHPESNLDYFSKLVVAALHFPGRPESTPDERPVDFFAIMLGTVKLGCDISR